MHHIYHTKGIVLKGKQHGESNKYLYLLTEEFGLIVALAQGIRELKSKLRYHLQDFSCISVDLVCGRSGWRLTNASPLSTAQGATFPEIQKFYFFSRISSLVLRLVHGEGKHGNLYSEIATSFSFVKERELTPEELFRIELVLVMKILFYLGYLDHKATGLQLLEEDVKTLYLNEEVSARKNFLIQTINSSLKATQL